MSTASRRVFGLWLEILARICPRQGLNLALGKVYALVATVQCVECLQINMCFDRNLTCDRQAPHKW